LASGATSTLERTAATIADRAAKRGASCLAGAALAGRPAHAQTILALPVSAARATLDLSTAAIADFTAVLAAFWHAADGAHRVVDCAATRAKDDRAGAALTRVGAALTRVGTA
jgi:hypothetical protein